MTAILNLFSKKKTMSKTRGDMNDVGERRVGKRGCLLSGKALNEEKKRKEEFVLVVKSLKQGTGWFKYTTPTA